MALWTPDLLSSLRAWYDFSDAASLTLDSGFILGATDKSGNGYNLTGPASRRPQHLITFGGGLKVAEFDGVDDVLQASAPLLQVDHSLFIVFRAIKGATTAFRAVFGGWASGAAGRFLLTCHQTCVGGSNADRINPFNGSATGGACTGAGAGLMSDVALPDRHLMIESLSTAGTGGWRVFTDGTLKTTSTVASLYQGIGSAIGDANGTTAAFYPYKGSVAEVVIASESLSDTDRLLVEGYLAHKWGLADYLPSNHPYKALAPRTTGGVLRKIAGVTRLDGAIAQATLRLYDAATGALRAEVLSDPSTGEYAFEDATNLVMTGGETFFVLADYGAGVRPLAHGPISPNEPGSSVLWTPANITTSFWVDAADLFSFTFRDSFVAQWNDKSGQLKHGVQATTGSQPTYVGNVLNSRAGVLCSPFGWMNISGTLPLTENMTVFEVFQRSTTGIISMTLGGAATSAPPYAIQWWSDNIRYSALNGGADFNTHGAANLTTGPFITSLRRGSDVQLWSNGAAVGTAGTANPISGAAFSYIARRANNYHSGYIHEVVVVPSALNTSDRQRVEGYLAHKWGLVGSLPSDHPYKSDPPYLT